MNWYFEEQGVSRGPLTEERMIAKVKAGELSGDVLIWQPEMKEWREITAVKPEWLPNSDSLVVKKEPSSISGIENQPAAIEPKSAAKRNAAPVAAEEVIPPAPLSEASPESNKQTPSPKGEAAQSKLKPKAPVEALAADEPKSGLFKRVFGLGGKKK
jgi:hypothetical protein